MIKPVKIGLLGFGTVGQGVAQLLNRSGNEIARRAGRPIEIVGAFVRHLDRENPYRTPLTTDVNALLNDPDIDIIVEMMGGIHPAKDYILHGLAQGKHIVTANKALIAEQGQEIFRLAQNHGRMVSFEAAVAGGIPVIKTIREGMAGNQIEWVAGIINGTSNFILTEMKEKHAAFSDALAQAQALGYAEADPTFDIEGIDAAHKLSILAALAFGIPLPFDHVFIEGITEVTLEDVDYADELGYCIKHLGIAKRQAGGIEVRVHPTLIPKQRLLAHVNGVMNAVLIKGDATGPILTYGAGAGAEPTASAIIADLVDLTRTLSADPEHRVPYLAFQSDQLVELPILPIDAITSAYYLRLKARDQPGVLAEITHILCQHHISIKQIVQKKSNTGAWATIILVTHRTQEADMQQAIKQMQQLDVIHPQIASLRIEALFGS